MEAHTAHDGRGLSADLAPEGGLWHPPAGEAWMSIQGVEWTQGATIARGGNGTVYTGHDRNGTVIAIKVQRLPGGPDKAKVTNLLREVGALEKLNHRNVVEYMGSVMDEQQLYIFMAFEPQSLAQLLKGGMHEAAVRNCTRQILLGLEYVHAQGIAHHDIKAANILVSRSGIIKLTDFGAARIHQPTDVSSNLQSVTGTPHWMSPEMCRAAMGQGGAYSGAKADVWGVGVTVIEMMMGRHPWAKIEGLHVIWQVVNNTEGLPRPPNASADALNFLDRCLQHDPAQRASVTQLLAHPFLVSLGSSDADELRLSSWPTDPSDVNVRVMPSSSGNETTATSSW